MIRRSTKHARPRRQPIPPGTSADTGPAAPTVYFSPAPAGSSSSPALLISFDKTMNFDLDDSADGGTGWTITEGGSPHATTGLTAISPTLLTFETDSPMITSDTVVLTVVTTPRVVTSAGADVVPGENTVPIP